MKELVCVCQFKENSCPEEAVAQRVQEFVYVGVKKGDDVFMDSECNFDTRNERVEKGLKVK